MQTFTILAPVFLIIFLGVLLRRGGFLGEEAPKILNRYCYWIGLPPLLFLKIGLAQTDISAALTTLGICVGVTLSLALIALSVGLAMRLSMTRAVTMMHVAMRGNLAYIGLTVIFFAFAGQPQGGHAESIAALTLGPLIILYNVIPSIAHVLAAHHGGQGLCRKVLLQLIKNPLILASVGGLAWNLLLDAHGIPLPLIFHRSFELLGGSALPIALLCVGCGLAESHGIHAILPSAFAALIKTLLGILLALLFARILRAGPVETAVALILMATPTAIASYIMVKELHGDADIAAGTIAISTLISLLTLPLALSLAM